MEVLVLEVLEVLVLEVLKVLEVLEVLAYSTPSQDCVHCEIPPNIVRWPHFCAWIMWLGCDYNFALTCAGHFLENILENTKDIYCDSNWGCV